MAKQHHLTVRIDDDTMAIMQRYLDDGYSKSDVVRMALDALASGDVSPRVRVILDELLNELTGTTGKNLTKGNNQ